MIFWWALRYALGTSVNPCISRVELIYVETYVVVRLFAVAFVVPCTMMLSLDMIDIVNLI